MNKLTMIYVFPSIEEGTRFMRTLEQGALLIEFEPTKEFPTLMKRKMTLVSFLTRLS